MKRLGTILVALLTIISCKNEDKKELTPKQISSLTISTDKPSPGETINITYDSNNVSDAFYQYIVDTKNYPVDLDFDFENNKLKSSIKIPDSAQAITFIFKSDDKYDDNNKQGYVMPLYGKDGKQSIGSNSAVAYYGIRNGSFYGIKSKNEDVLKVLKKDIETHPELKKDWETSYLELAYQTDKDNGKILIDKYLDQLSEKSNKSEKEFTNLMNFHNTIGNTSKSDSIKSIILNKFPKGKTASLDLAKRFNSETDLDKKLALFETYLSNNPKMDDYSDSMAISLAYIYIEKDDMVNFDKYSKMVNNKNRLAYGLNNLAWSYAEQGEKLEVAEKLSKTTLNLIEVLQKDPKGKPEYTTQRNYEKGLKSSYSMFADTYALIKFEQGKVKEAIAYQEKAHDPKAQDTEANARYISYLMADKQYESVVDKATKFIKLGNGNDEIIKAYKTAYQNIYPSAKDVNDKIAELEKEGYNKSVAKIKSKMIDEEAPQFTMKDTEGKDIVLSDLKGKIVILDFWATWCGPCKASFPGMQKVVTKYSNDENIMLLFVDTFERGENKEQLVEDFIAKNNYDFHVVYDIEDKDSKRFEVADKYEVNGIPTKVIIDPDGKMRFKSVGYSGSVDKLVSEMDIMIDILKS